MCLRTWSRSFLIALSLYLTSAHGESWTRLQIYEALRSGKILNPDRLLVHFSHTCNLNIAGASYPVVDVEELVKGSAVPRGVNRIIVFAPTLKPLQQIDYTSQRPLFCQENRLYVYGDLTLNNTLPEGNVLTFEAAGRSVNVSHVEPNDLPVPATRSRKQPPQ